jgi:hypothetical protein
MHGDGANDTDTDLDDGKVACAQLFAKLVRLLNIALRRVGQAEGTSKQDRINYNEETSHPE